MSNFGNEVLSWADSRELRLPIIANEASEDGCKSAAKGGSFGMISEIVFEFLTLFFGHGSLSLSKVNSSAFTCQVYSHLQIKKYIAIYL